MSDQHFEHADNVAGRDFIQHIYPSGGRLALGLQKWAAKRYVAGTFLTSGWLAFFTSLAFIVFALLQALFAIHGLFTHAPAPNSLLFYLQLILIPIMALVAGLAGRVWSRGFVGFPRTQRGIARDIHGYVFIGRLGGNGSVCPLCQVKLHFHDLGLCPILRCTRNSDHWWAFDFTTVKD
jgi:hypothetical protein